MNRVSPTSAHERIADVDMLRGFALLGVFLSNFVSFSGGSVMADQSQLAALPTAWWDSVIHLFLNWLVDDKANTLFALLFGVGFAIQQQRAERAGSDARTLLTRRMLVLLGFGVLHLFLLWPWDVLHVYAITGFVLIGCSRLKTRNLLLIGLPLAFFGRELATLIDLVIGNSSSGYGNEQALIRQELGAAGEYLALMRNFAHVSVVDYLGRGDMVAWVLYSTGRAMVGMWIARKALLLHTERRLPAFRVLMWACLPAGLLLSGFSEYLGWAAASGKLPQLPAAQAYASLLHRLSSPIVAAGYVGMLVLTLHTRLGAAILTPLATAGRMAFTNYVMQSALTLLILTGVGPGLALAGYIGVTESILIVFACFALQVAFSQLWLAHFSMGPLEWVWRSLTYGRLVRHRRPQQREERDDADLTAMRGSSR